MFLNPLEKSDGEKFEFSVCDVEARDWENFLCIGFFDGEIYRHFYTLSDFLDFIFRIRVKVCFAHFGGGYDFQFILDALLRGRKYELVSVIPVGSRILFFSVKHKGHTILFRDSAALLPFSLRSLAASFGVKHQKGTIDYEEINEVTDELLEYLELDCRALWETLHVFSQWEFVRQAGVGFTTAGQAMRVFRRTLQRPLKGLGEGPDAFVRSGYFGGRVEIFKPLHEGPKPLRSYDANSLFPAMMHAHDMPGNFLGYVWKRSRKHLGYFEARVEVPDCYLPPLGTRESGKLLFPTGRFDGVFSSQELEYLEECGGRVISVSRGALFENRGKLFREYVDTLWAIREKSKAGTVDNILAKLLLNCLYGRFGLRRKKEKFVVDEGQDGFRLLRELDFAGKTVRIGAVPEISRTFTNVAIAAAVTSHARIHMHRIMRTVESTLYYTDTDSVFTTTKMKTGTGLGELKLEGEYPNAAFLLPKTYFAEGRKNKSGELEQVTMKGFEKRKVQHFGFDDFRTALRGEMELFKVKQGGRGLNQIRTALQRGKLVEKRREQTKQLRSSYDKRILYEKSGKWDSRPHKIDG